MSWILLVIFHTTLFKILTLSICVHSGTNLVPESDLYFISDMKIIFFLKAKISNNFYLMELLILGILN